MDQYFKPINSSFLRLNYYPICDSPADPFEDNPQQGHLGISHHTDAGALTLLTQDKVAGLQFYHQDAWHGVDPIANALVVNIGDLMQVWSNNLLKAPVHRVTANKTLKRFSAAFFFNPSFSTECRPLINLNTPQYRPVHWREFRQARAAGDYANQGNESQISDYLI